MKAITKIVFRRELRTALWWSLGLGALMLLVVASYPSLAEQETLDELWESYPEELRELFGGAESITELEGYLDSQLYSLLPLLLGIMGIAQASRALAGAEESGYLDLPLSTPLRRQAWFMAHALAILASQIVVVGLMGLLLVAGLLAFQIEGDLGVLFFAGFDAIPAGWVLASITLLASAFAHRKRIAIGIGTSLVIGLFFIGGLAPIVPALENAKFVSPFYYYGQSDALHGTLDATYYIVCLSAGWLAHVGAWLRFRHKDLFG